MLYRLAADAVLVVHLLFIVYILFGGLLVWRWPRTAWLHLPTVAYGAAIEFVGWICPLTPLENALREAAGQQGYAGGFIEHYLLPIVYPAGLTPTVQLVLGAVVLALNLGVYGAWAWRRRRRRGLSDGPGAAKRTEESMTDSED